MAIYVSNHLQNGSSSSHPQDTSADTFKSVTLQMSQFACLILTTPTSYLNGKIPLFFFFVFYLLINLTHPMTPGTNGENKQHMLSLISTYNLLL